MKQQYRVPFERNSDHVKLRYEHLQVSYTILALLHWIWKESWSSASQAYIGGRGRFQPCTNKGLRHIINVPGQRGGSITMCVAILVKMVSFFTIMQSKTHTALHTLTHFWTPCTTD
ncbi:hypothetical protein N1851_013241 [Merluccius polli]|uniref:Uncharacterized protein n=1 Tax=Merluccius polli TaxID=89951 RepID=A0AA47MW98_MERPO|nr:hypothetical protein N1851_013241 [Merluccius polli]